jgi:hypothetical protein
MAPRRKRGRLDTTKPAIDVIPELMAAVKKIVHSEREISLEDMKKQLPAHGVNLNFENPAAEENVRHALQSISSIEYRDQKAAYCWSNEEQLPSKAQAGGGGRKQSPVGTGQTRDGLAEKQGTTQESIGQQAPQNGLGYARRRASIKASEKLSRLSKDMNTSNAHFFAGSSIKAEPGKGKDLPDGKSEKADVLLKSAVPVDNLRCVKNDSRKRRCAKQRVEGQKFCQHHLPKSGKEKVSDAG